MEKVLFFINMFWFFCFFRMVSQFTFRVGYMFFWQFCFGLGLVIWEILGMIQKRIKVQVLASRVMVSVGLFQVGVLCCLLSQVYMIIYIIQMAMEVEVVSSIKISCFRQRLKRLYRAGQVFMKAFSSSNMIQMSVMIKFMLVMVQVETAVQSVLLLFRAFVLLFFRISVMISYFMLMIIFIRVSSRVMVKIIQFWGLWFFWVRKLRVKMWVIRQEKQMVNRILKRNWCEVQVEKLGFIMQVKMRQKRFRVFSRKNIWVFRRFRFLVFCIKGRLVIRMMVRIKVVIMFVIVIVFKMMF